MKLLLADDHALIRQGFESALSDLDRNTQFVHAHDRHSVVEQLAAHHDIDVIVMDLFMPGVDGFDLLHQICDDYSHIPVIVVSGTEDPRYMRKSIDYGASGYVPKSAETDAMVEAIEVARKGGVYIPPEMNKRVESLCSDDELLREDSRSFEIRESATKLTARQREVLELLSRGMSNKVIARALDVSDHTVKVHVAAILKVLAAANRTEAVVLARNAGIIDL